MAAQLYSTTNLDQSDDDSEEATNIRTVAQVVSDMLRSTAAAEAAGPAESCPPVSHCPWQDPRPATAAPGFPASVSKRKSDRGNMPAPSYRRGSHKSPTLADVRLPSPPQYATLSSPPTSQHRPKATQHEAASSRPSSSAPAPPATTTAASTSNKKRKSTLVHAPASPALAKSPPALALGVSSSSSRPIAHHQPNHPPPAAEGSATEPPLFHKTSEWLEPARDDGLTLYEVHRLPRPWPPSGGSAAAEAAATTPGGGGAAAAAKLRRPIVAIQSELRCAICLETVRQARTVMECLHRFCAACLEESIRRYNKHCPVCRSPIPNKRCLAVDRRVDILVQSLLGGIDEMLPSASGTEAVESESALTAAGEPPDPSLVAERALEAGDNQSDWLAGSGAAGIDEMACSLQQAIHYKRLQQLHHLSSQQRILASSPSSSCTEQYQHHHPPPSLSTRVLDDSEDRKVLVELRRHEAERDLDELLLPYLRLSERAPLRVIVTFLRHKLGLVTTVVNSRLNNGEEPEAARAADHDEHASENADEPTALYAMPSPGGGGLMLFLSKRKPQPSTSKKKRKDGADVEVVSAKSRTVTLTDRNDHSRRGGSPWDTTTLRELCDRHSINGPINLLYKRAD